MAKLTAIVLPMVGEHRTTDGKSASIFLHNPPPIPITARKMQVKSKLQNAGPWDFSISA